MVEYDYPDLFYTSQLKKDILMVDSDATVTKVTNQAPTVSGKTYIFQTADFKAEAFELNESLCSDDNLTFGLCESASLNVTVRNKTDYPNLEGIEFNVYFYFNGNSDTLFQVGTYTVDKDEYTSDRNNRELELHDALYYLREYDITAWYNDTFSDGLKHDIGSLRTDLIDWLGEQEPQMTIEQEDVELINDDMEIGATIESDVITFEFFMQKILEVNGVFGHINREGIFVYTHLIGYDNDPVIDITNSMREPHAKYKDYTVWAIHYVDVYDQDNRRLYRVGTSSWEHPNRYRIIDSFVFSGVEKDDPTITAILQNLRDYINKSRYRPFEAVCGGNLCLEVGDRIGVQYGKDEQGNPKIFHTYILERRFTGIGTFKDEYSARGDKKQPKYRLKTDSNWHTGDSSVPTSGSGTGGVANIDDEFKNKFVNSLRNIGLRLLDEPTNVSVNYIENEKKVKIKWKDPGDINTSEPIAVTWAGTKVIKSTSKEIWHEWDGTVLVDSTTRDAYEETALVDTNIDLNQNYYYGIFPYDTNGRVRFTKVLSVNTVKELLAPMITGVSDDDVVVTVNYSIPTGNWDYVKLVYKKDSIPTSVSDGTAVDITGSSITLSGLKGNSLYYFVIFAKDLDSGEITQSDAVDHTTGNLPSLEIIDIQSVASTRVPLNKLAEIVATDYYDSLSPSDITSVGINLKSPTYADTRYNTYVNYLQTADFSLQYYLFQSAPLDEVFHGNKVSIPNYTSQYWGGSAIFEGLTDYAANSINTLILVADHDTQEGYYIAVVSTSNSSFYVYNPFRGNSSEKVAIRADFYDILMTYKV